MKTHYYSILDKKAGLYGTPVIFNSQSELLRSLDYMLNVSEKRKNDFRFIYAEDYCLVHVFDFDPDNGEVTNHFPGENPFEFALIKKSDDAEEPKVEKND